MKNTHKTNSETNILVVDDTPDNLRLLAGLLSGQGYIVRPAASGAHALAAAREEPPDLILLDVNMPEMDGYEVCKRLKVDERTGGIPVIFISALDALQDKIKGFEVGGIDYITKPFQAKEVLARVQTHVTLRKLQQQLEQNNIQLHQEIVKREEAEEELRVMNDHLEDANQQLQEANAGKDTFFSIIAHDLRGPFTGLMGLTEALAENIEHYSQERLKSLLTQMHASAKNTYTLLSNLLEWSRFQRGLLEWSPDCLPLSEIAERNVRLFLPQAKQKQVALENLVPSGVAAHADYKMTETVIRNLLSNALKFTKAGDSISIVLQGRHDNYVELAVADTGIGMSQETLDALFRLDKKTSRPGTAGEEGSGLGLILCNEFIKKNGGAIRVESEVDKGSRFIVSLPHPGAHSTREL